MPRIRHLYLSPGHNFFGHQAGAPGTHPMLEQPVLRCVAGRGVEGDRFFHYKANYRGQITFFAWEEYRRLCAELAVEDREPSVFRRNVIVEGADLNALIGEEFELQGVRFAGTAECSPCHWMDYAFHAGAEAALKGCGGLRARILSDGELRVG